MKRSWHYKRRAIFATEQKRIERPQGKFNCERKRAFRSERVAQRAADESQAKVRERGRDDVISVYQCPHCKEFHLTSRRPR